MATSYSSAGSNSPNHEPNAPNLRGAPFEGPNLVRPVPIPTAPFSPHVFPHKVI